MKKIIKKLKELVTGVSVTKVSFIAVTYTGLVDGHRIVIKPIYGGIVLDTQDKKVVLKNTLLLAEIYDSVEVVIKEQVEIRLKKL